MYKPEINWLHLPRTMHDLFAVNQIIDKNSLRIVTLLLYSNKINSLNSEQFSYLIQSKTWSELSEGTS